MIVDLGKGRGWPVSALTVNRKGVIGLVKVTADLVERGYEVFTPTSDSSPVDVVVAEPYLWSLRRLQIKYRTVGKDGGCLCLARLGCEWASRAR